MKKIYLTAALISGIAAFAQEKKTDSVEVKKIEDVVITKKVFQKKSDRLVYDVSASPANKGASAFDLLKETPTITTTDDKEFKILGKSEVVVYINGRKSTMEQAALLAMLRGTPSENISKIEAISVPGSEFDVPGNTGIINIVMKKKTTDGINGTLRMKNEKAYYDNPSSSLSVNFRKGKLGGNFSGGLADEKYRENITLENGNATARTLSEGIVEGPNKTYYANIALDYDANEKNFLSWNLNTLYLPTKDRMQSFFNQNYENGVLKSTSLLRGSGNSESKNITTALNYEHLTDDRGSKLKLNGAYLYYNKDQEDFNRNYTSPGEVLKSGFNQITPQVINNFSFQGDYIKKFKNESTASFGGNFSYTKTDNDTNFETGDGITFVKSADLSNHFIYNENIAAVYANYERKFGEKVSGKVGMRYETTFTKGDILGKDDPLYHFKKNYGNVLPFLNLNYNISENNNLSYNFSSRVRRPSFWELNPVRNYTTENNYIQNNPFMVPTKIYSQELMYMHKNAYFITLGHTFSKDKATQIPLQKLNANGEMELRYIRTNYGDEQDFSATLGMQKSFYKGAWNASYSATVNHTKYTGRIDTDPLTHEVFDPYIVDRKTTFLVLSANNQIALDKKKSWWLGADYILLTPQELELGRLSLIQSLNLSLKKNWENWTFTANVDDVLKTNNHITIENSDSRGYFSNVKQGRYSRQVSVSVTYNFGNKKIKAIRKDDSANKDIKSRTGGK